MTVMHLTQPQQHCLDFFLNPDFCGGREYEHHISKSDVAEIYHEQQSEVWVIQDPNLIKFC